MKSPWWQKIKEESGEEVNSDPGHRTWAWFYMSADRWTWCNGDCKCTNVCKLPHTYTWRYRFLLHERKLCGLISVNDLKVIIHIDATESHAYDTCSHAIDASPGCGRDNQLTSKPIFDIEQWWVWVIQPANSGTVSASSLCEPRLYVHHHKQIEELIKNHWLLKE